MAATPCSGMDQLAEMFPALSLATVQDVVEQCANNCEVALERLLAMTESPAGCPLPPAPSAPQTREATYAMLFPAEKGRNPSKPSGATPHPGHRAGTEFLKATSDHHQDKDPICPWLAPALDTGQRRKVQATPRASRRWWPSGPWQVAGTSVGTSLPLPCCSHVDNEICSTAEDNLLDSCKYCTPPRPVPPSNESFGSASTPSKTPPATPLLSLDGASNQHPAGIEPACCKEAASPCSSDDELAALMPHLAHCLASPSMSGAASPMPAATATTSALVPAPVPLPTPLPMAPLREEPALALPGQQLQQAAQQEGYAPADLVQAVAFHLHMFPSLKREVVADVLQRYSDAPQTALDQLIMLSSCVEDAAAVHSNGTAAGDSGRASIDVPDQQGWEDAYSSGSSSSDEGEGAVGASWGQALTPAELAAMEQGVFPPAAVCPAELSRASSPAGICDSDDLPADEKLQLLKAEFTAVAGEEVSGALAACDGSLFAAAELLRSFAAEDAASAASTQGQHQQERVAAAAASVPAAALPLLADNGGDGGGMPQHTRPKVQHLARRFPEVPTEALEVALQSCDYDLAAARLTLQEAGYTEAELELAPLPTALPALTAPLLLPAPVPLPPPATEEPLAGLLLPDIAAGSNGSMSLSEATYLRNQTIFEQERAQQQKLQQCYRKCFELASQAYARGDHTAAHELRMKGHEYKEQYDSERRRASKRISKRVNEGNMPVIRVDLHGCFVDEALQTVESGVRNLPESIPGGVVVRYITGKGLHSTGGAARIKPEVMRLLSERGVPFVEGPGWVEATLVPAP